MRIGDSGGELLDACHNPPLLVEWGEGDFVFRNIRRADCRVISRTLGANLILERGCANEEIQKPRINCGVGKFKEKVVTADNGSSQIIGNNPKAADLCVYLSNQEFASPTHLLLLGLDLGSADNVPKNNTLRMQLDADPCVGFQIVDVNEFHPLPNKSPQRYDWPIIGHNFVGAVREPPLRHHRSAALHITVRRHNICLISAINSAMRCSFFKISSANCWGGRCSKSCLALGFLMSRFTETRGGSRTAPTSYFSTSLA